MHTYLSTEQVIERKCPFYIFQLEENLVGVVGVWQ